MKNILLLIRRNIKLVYSLLVGLGLVAIIEGACFFGSIEAGMPYENPSLEHWFGTVDWGGDMALYVRHALVRSILVASLISLPAVALGYIVGGVWALSLAGSKRHNLIAVAVMGLLGPTPVVLMLAILHMFSEPNASGVLIVAMISVAWPGIALRFRNEIQDLLQRPFIKSARAQGAGQFDVLMIEMLPVLMPVLEKTVLLAFIFGIEAEALVGYLGIGETNASIGRLLQESIAAFENGEPKFVHGIRYMIVVGSSVGCVIGALKLLTAWRDDRRVMRANQAPLVVPHLPVDSGWTVDVTHRSSGAKLVADATIPHLPGQLTVIAGASGSGKSLAARAIADTLHPDLKSKTTIVGLAPLAKKIVIVPQGLQEHFSDSFSIGQYLDFLKVGSGELATTLSEVGLSVDELKEPNGVWKTGRQISGGMSQKLAVALAARGSASVLVFDETIAALDWNAAEELGTLMRRLLNSREGLAIIVVNHRHRWTQAFADHVVFFDRGTTVWSDRNVTFWADTESTNCSGSKSVENYKAAVKALDGTPAESRTEEVARYDSELLLKVSELLPYFGTRIRPISFTVHSGEVVAITGANGMGKTTILRTLAGELAPAHGSMTVQSPPSPFRNDSSVTSAAHHRLRMCSQNPTESLNPCITVGRILKIAARRLGLRGTDSMRGIVEQACVKVSLPLQHLGKTPRELSGGLRARASLACSLLGDVQILLLDEPTAGLDPEVAVELLDTFRHLTRNGVGIVTVMHDSEQLDYLFAKRVPLELFPNI